MSRNEGRVGTGCESAIDAAEILEEIAAGERATRLDRRVAVARYLAAGEGWREASTTLGGAFAPAPLPRDG